MAPSDGAVGAGAFSNRSCLFSCWAKTGLLGGDHLADLAGGLLRAVSQRAHLVGHHGEAAAVLAGTRSLDGRIESAG